MAVIAMFFPGAGILSVFGDALANAITLSRNAGGQILVNGGAVKVLGGTPTVANVSQIQAFGLAGNDVITIDESNGPMPRATIFAGRGNDTVTGGSAGDLLFGQSGDDVLDGKGGADFLFGGSGHDVLTGGDGNDQVFGEAGDDLFVWNPGDDSDLYEGGSGFDTAEINGGGASETFTVTANGARVRFDRLDPAPFAIDMGTMEKLELNMGGGNDTFTATGNLAALIKISVDGGAGNDTILGSNGIDFLSGGTGNDFIDGQQGSDDVSMGAGEDVFQFDPGDGSDTVDGGADFDTLLFNGSAGNEIFELKASALSIGRSILTRNLGNIVTDMVAVEQITLNALGGADTITINDTTGTDVQAVNVNLSGTIGGVAVDGAADTVIVNATDGQDVIRVLGTAGDLLVSGLNAAVFVADAEADKDSLVVNGLGGDDVIEATTMGAGNVKLTLDGGAGNDQIAGSQGADTLLGGEGNDVLFGDDGNDVALMGAGDDVFIWVPGDENDVVEGGDGQDAMQFFGDDNAEAIDIVANGSRALFLRDVATVVMDLNSVEIIDFKALGGGDSILVGDLSGTDVKQIELDLRGPAGTPDGAADTVTVNATIGADQITIVDVGTTSLSVVGLSADVHLRGLDAALDRLVLNGQAGADVIDASALKAGIVNLTMNGGLGNDLFRGSEGDDLINGGDGDDVAFMGAGDDVFFCAPGDDDDTVEGQDGFDELLFAGANIAETITIFANGGRAIFTRDVANVVMDNNDVEKITFLAGGGADVITVQDLSATDVQQVDINLGAFGGGGDGAVDRVIVNGTEGDDVIVLLQDGADLLVTGLGYDVRIRNFEATDQLVVNGFGGDDVIDASALATEMLLRLNGLEGDDQLIGGGGADIITGGNGDDVLIGGLGVDTLLGGAGDNVIIQ